LKSSGPEEIMMAVRAAATGDSVLSPRSARKLLNHLNRDVATPERRRAVDLVNTLSDREREVVVRVAQGLSNARVAQQLYVSEGTVKTHLASAQSRLGVRNRVEVAVLAERAGLLTGWATPALRTGAGRACPACPRAPPSALSIVVEHAVPQSLHRSGSDRSCGPQGGSLA